MKNQELFNEKRKLYMDGKITHTEFYLWLASFIGVTKAHLPVSQETINKSTDVHLNDGAYPLTARTGSKEPP